MPPDSMTMLTSSNTADVIDYLIASSTLSMQTGEYAWAKSCLITAIALAPENFLIKYESYKMCKSEGSISDAAKQFADLFSPTSLQPVTVSSGRSKKVDAEKQKQFLVLKELFLDEMKLLLMAISDEWCDFSRNDLTRFLQFEEPLSDENTKFYRNLYGELKKADQINCLTKFAIFFTDHQEVTVDLLLHIIAKYSSESPEVLSDCAGRLIDIKQQLEQKADSSQQPLTVHLRKKYIFHILPALFGCSSKASALDETKIKPYFFDAIKYFVEDFIISPVPSNTSAKNEYEHKLVEIVRLIGRRQSDWRIFKTTEFNPTHVETTLATITAFVESFISSSDHEPMDLSSANSTSSSDQEPRNTEQVLYYSLVLFVICFANYSATLGESIFVERLHTGLDQTKSFLPSKKRKLIQQFQPQPQVIASCKKLVDYFNVLVRLNKIFRNVLKNDFNNFIKHVHLVDNPKYTQLQVDALLFGGSYLEVNSLIATLDKSQHPAGDPLCQVKRYMQRISCCIRQNEQSTAVQNLVHLIDLVTLDVNVMAYLSSSSTTSDSHSTISYCDLNTFLELASSSATRQLILLPLTQDNIVGFIIDCCMCVLKDAALSSARPSDLALGHMMVLSQFSWPYYYEVFKRVTESLEKRNSSTSLAPKVKFTYQLFTQFILTPDILEMFMSMVDSAVTFELGPTLIDPNQPLNLHSTRGVTRSYREDITALLQKQAHISQNQLPVDLFQNFLAVHIKAYLSDVFKLTNRQFYIEQLL